MKCVVPDIIHIDKFQRGINYKPRISKASNSIGARNKLNTLTESILKALYRLCALFRFTTNRFFLIPEFESEGIHGRKW